MPQPHISGMIQTELRYGRSFIPFTYDAERFVLLSRDDYGQELSDMDIGLELDRPIGSPNIEEIASPDDTVLIVVRDTLHRTATGQIVNLLIRRLIAAGTLPFNISIIFATGNDRAVTDQEKSELLTPFIFQRIKTIDHSARDLAGIVRCGETSTGIKVELNRALLEHDHIFTVGGIGFDHLDGFTGGIKLICPGLASAKTISSAQRLAFDLEKTDSTCDHLLEKFTNDPVHKTFVEAASKVTVAFAINYIVNRSGAVSRVFCGDLLTSHQAACDHFAQTRTLAIEEKFDLVVADCGGYPHDISIIQAQTSLEAAARICKPGGTIIIAAECIGGLGKSDLLKWFDAADSSELAERLKEAFQINGRMAWNILRTAETFDVRILTELDNATCRKIRMTRYETINDALAGILPSSRGAIVTSASELLFITNSSK